MWVSQGLCWAEWLQTHCIFIRLGADGWLGGMGPQKQPPPLSGNAVLHLGFLESHTHLGPQASALTLVKTPTGTVFLQVPFCFLFPGRLGLPSDFSKDVSNVFSWLDER